MCRSLLDGSCSSFPFFSLNNDRPCTALFRKKGGRKKEKRKRREGKKEPAFEWRCEMGERPRAALEAACLASRSIVKSAISKTKGGKGEEKKKKKGKEEGRKGGRRAGSLITGPGAVH